MAFTPRRLFMYVNPTFFAAFRCFHALTINNRRAWFWLVLIFYSDCSHQRFIDALPQTLFLPPSKVTIHGLPRRQVFGHHTPLTSSTNHVQDCIDNLPHFPLAWAPHVVGWKKVRNYLPFGILEVGRVGLVE